MGKIVIVVVAWLAGFLAYVAAGLLLYGQRISTGDLTVTAGFSAAAVVVACGLYLPLLWLLRTLLRGPRPAWAFALAAAAVAPLPTALVFSAVATPTWRTMRTQEAVLFYVLFGVFGVVLGAGYSRLHALDAGRR